MEQAKMAYKKRTPVKIRFFDGCYSMPFGTIAKAPKDEECELMMWNGVIIKQNLVHVTGDVIKYKRKETAIRRTVVIPVSCVEEW